ncbi:phage antirepressor KilAC domain-containing protein [Anaerococcus sp. mt242]|uniref:phage antirepressor n=1 Tax=Anaerococcus sp. mt242 TaxID=2661917 RepID=UPI001931FC6F|nr:phage antirepressor KilAC domain-containing protein [Anaerococcus sp. mt242]MBM0046808.1 phage antirepressor KilAC domain-containing protein [Anaerococcus sp. mt242]
MTNLKIFENSIFGELRTITDEFGQPWFVGKDVAEALKYRNGSRDINRHVDELDRKKEMINDGNQLKETILINESGLYSLIFSSKMEKAKEFKRWVTSEVLPAIRKDGGYMVTKEGESEEELIARALIVAQKSIDRLELENKQKDQIIGELRPKADYVDKILQNTSLIKVSSIAKDYGMSAQDMNKLLHELRIQYKQGDQWLLYANIQDKGYTSSETHVYKKKDGTTDVNLLTKWTQKGRMFLYEELKRNGYLPMIERV